MCRPFLCLLIKIPVHFLPSQSINEDQKRDGFATSEGLTRVMGRSGLSETVEL